MSFQPPNQPENQHGPGQQPGSPYPPTSSTPTSSTPIPGPAPFGGAPGAPGNAGFPGGMPGNAGFPGGPGFNQTGGFQPSNKGGSGAKLFTILVFAVPLIGLGVGAFLYFNAKSDADKKTQEVLDQLNNITVPDFTVPDFTVPSITVPSITVPSITVPSITVPPITVTPLTLPGTVVPIAPTETTLDATATTAVGVEPTVAETVPAPGSWLEADGPVQFTNALEAAISGEPSRFLTIAIYPTYGFAQAQDANNLAHVDEYPVQGGVVGPSSPVNLVGGGELEPSLFSLADVDWAVVSASIAAAPGQTTIEEPAADYVLIERSSFIEGNPVTVKVYVNGPRGGGFVEYDGAGTLIKVVQ